MQDKTPQCSQFKRHKWTWAKNIWRAVIGPRTGRATLRGVYRCECGARKVGQPDISYEKAKEPA